MWPKSQSGINKQHHQTPAESTTTYNICHIFLQQSNPTSDGETDCRTDGLTAWWCGRVKVLCGHTNTQDYDVRSDGDDCDDSDGVVILIPMVIVMCCCYPPHKQQTVTSSTVSSSFPSTSSSSLVAKSSLTFCAFVWMSNKHKNCWICPFVCLFCWILFVLF